jgi:hypothetical protein
VHRLAQIIAEKLTDLENHETVAEHNSELFTKLTFFYFLNYNAALFYIAFLKKSVEGACFDPLTGLNDCGRELGTQTLIVYLSNDFGWRMCTSVILPPLINFIKGKMNDLDEVSSTKRACSFSTMGHFGSDCATFWTVNAHQCPHGMITFLGPIKQL